jgi:SAM-dependent methyltransferase
MPRRCRYLARDWRAIGPIFVKGGRRHDKRASAMNATSPRPPRPTLWKRWEHGHVKPLLRRLKPWRQTCFGGIAVSFKTHLDGGGSSFGQDFIPFLRERGMPRLGRVFEWCAGPGFIGFSLLGHGLCDSLCLADINPEAVAACERTVARNRLGGRVSVYRSDNLSGIPSTERWDLVVSNPPHFDEASGDLRSADGGWRIHRGFFASVGRFLKPGGLVLLQENNAGSTAEDFRPLVEEAGMSILFVSGGKPARTPEFRMYFIAIARTGDTPPAWAGFTKAL